MNPITKWGMILLAQMIAWMSGIFLLYEVGHRAAAAAMAQIAVPVSLAFLGVDLMIQCSQGTIKYSKPCEEKT